MTEIEKIRSIARDHRHKLNVDGYSAYGEIVGIGSLAWFHGVRGIDDIVPESSTGQERRSEIFNVIRQHRADVKARQERSKAAYREGMEAYKSARPMPKIYRSDFRSDYADD